MGHDLMYYIDPTTNGIYVSIEHFLRAAGQNKRSEQLIEISDEEHSKITKKLSRGYSLNVSNGKIKTKPPCLATPTEQKSIILNTLDTIADKARARHQSVGQLLDLEYQQVIAAHSRWYTDGYNESKCPEDIKAWAYAEGVSLQQAAIDIAEASAWREEIISQIRAIRLAGKAALRSAPNDADFIAIAQPYIEQLNNIN